MNESVSPQVLSALEAAPIEAARRWLIPFCKRMDGQFMDPPHIRKIADVFDAVERGESRRVIISVHPGSGKSTLLQMACAWFLGRNPKRKIIATSAAERLAVRNSRATRDLFTDPQWPFDVTLASDAVAARLWETTQGGGLFAVGVGGVVTGWRGQLVVCDDLEDGQSSKLELDSLEEWFRAKLLTRCEPEAPIIVVQTRWPNDDLPRRLMNGPRGKQWEYIRMPALAEDDDLLGRAPGEALWPSRYDVSALEGIREDIGPRHFAAQYQGAPMNDGGNIIKSAWFQYYDHLPERFERVVAALDAASKTGVRNDYSAIVTIGVASNAYYVLDVVRKRVEYPELIRMVSMAFEKHRPSIFYAEDTSNATALIQQLQSESRLPVVAVKPIGSKESRVEAISGKIESGKLWLPKNAPWLADYESELCNFPLDDHDDMLDATTLLLNKLGANQNGLHWGKVRTGTPLYPWARAALKREEGRV